ncbi:MAG: DUF6934 family protein [Spirosomataceae bacterium]
MNYPKYKVTQNIDSQSFDFSSVSSKKTIHKKVIFTYIPDTDNAYNLALVDVIEDGLYDDLSVSNNNDLKEIIATVFYCIELFLNQNSKSIVIFTGSSDSRTRLYRIAISNNLEVTQNFIIKGFIDDDFEIFRPNRNYELFSIELKSKYSR